MANHNVSQHSFNGATLTPVRTLESIRGETVERTFPWKFLQFADSTTKYIVPTNAEGVAADTHGVQPVPGQAEILPRYGSYPPDVAVQRHSGRQTDDQVPGPVGVFFYGGV